MDVIKISVAFVLNKAKEAGKQTTLSLKWRHSDIGNSSTDISKVKI